jgi:ABC-2 type transport system permease protein
VLFLVLGYLVYGGIMAVGGAIAPNAREGNQITVFLILPLLPTLMFASEFAENPHGVLPIVLSLFPLSAPSAMVTRLAVAEVPTWQLFVSLGGLVATAYGFIILAGHFFRADNLLSNASFSWRRLLTGWRSS